MGKTAGETVRRVMRRLGTAELWLQYNFRGQRGKNAFVDLQNLLDLIRSKSTNKRKKEEKCSNIILQ